ncbi:putative TIR domain-containing protein [Helianthus annuus]|uniref:Putative toll/interleukin-1 receptor (TIR) domain-containing protein n=1 Tax=Helianthus annuus TaxID=4232 RepID=A0A251VDI6_HELAN|nr:putative TIR domain-containing protein [Helianthus annuus]
MASKLASSYSAPASSSGSWSYDVFLSFRGEDTRKAFVDHLYTALNQRLIRTYKDDETLPRGEVIGPSLMKTIEESHIAIVIFSKNYADSSWCLEELAHIMKCKDERKLIVMPVFYGVDPSDVRKQKSKFGEAFAKHEIENITKAESWRKALADVGNIAGWELKYIANGICR